MISSYQPVLLLPVRSLRYQGTWAACVWHRHAGIRMDKNRSGFYAVYSFERHGVSADCVTYYDRNAKCSRCNLSLDLKFFLCPGSCDTIQVLCKISDYDIQSCISVCIYLLDSDCIYRILPESCDTSSR